MKKKIFIYMFLILFIFNLNARESTPLDELKMIGNYVSNYYKKNSRLPTTLEELKSMRYFTDDEIQRRLTAMEKRFTLYISDSGNSWISITLVDDKNIYTLKYEVTDVSNFYFYKDKNLVLFYQSDLVSGNIRDESVPDIILSCD